MTDQELRSQLSDNRKTLISIEKRIKKIEKRLLWQTVWGIVKVVLIVGPIIVGLIYFTPIINRYFQEISPVLKFYSSLNPNNPIQEQLNNFFSGQHVDNQNTNDIDPQLIEAFCNPQSREQLVRQMCEN